MTRWQVTIPEQTDRMVRAHLTRRGVKESDLSGYVDRALRRAVFWDTLDAVREQNRQVDPAEIEQAVNQAMDETRADRS